MRPFDCDDEADDASAVGLVNVTIREVSIVRSLRTALVISNLSNSE